MQNIEIKVRVPDLHSIRDRALHLGAIHHWTHRQTDTYFHVPHGRLKLREEADDSQGTLISYSRPDECSSRFSHYQLLPVTEADTLKQMLTDSLGVLAVVQKRRELFLFGQTRIHLDDVERLGTFVELETVIGEQSADEAWAEHQMVCDALKLDQHKPVPVSYSDLTLKSSSR